MILSLSLPSSKSTFSQPFKEKFISDVVRIGHIIIFHLSKLWKAKFFILCNVIFLVRFQGKFGIDHTWEWKSYPSTNQDFSSRPKQCNADVLVENPSKTTHNCDADNISKPTCRVAKPLKDKIHCMERNSSWSSWYHVHARWWIEGRPSMAFRHSWKFSITHGFLKCPSFPVASCRKKRTRKLLLN